MISSVDIKVASIDDVDVVYNIDKECGSDSYSKEIISLSIKNDINFIAYIDNCAVGYISCSRVLDEAEVLKIVVLKEYRRKGIASLLMKNVINKLVEVDVGVLFLEVRSDNVPAKMLYEKIGFEKIYERQKYYSDGVDAYIYRLSLL